MNDWVGKMVVVSLLRGDTVRHKLINVGVAGAMFDDGGGGRMFVPWTSIHDVRLEAGDEATRPGDQ